MPTRNPADKVHYIVRFRDWRLTHSMTLAPDVPKMGTVLSGRVNSIIDACWHSSLPSAYPKGKRIQYFLVVNIGIGQTAPWISLLRNKTIRIRLGQLECVLSI